MLSKYEYMITCCSRFIFFFFLHTLLMHNWYPISILFILNFQDTFIVTSIKKIDHALTRKKKKIDHALRPEEDLNAYSYISIKYI